MNWKTTDKIIVYSRNTESGYEIRKALFVNLRPLDMYALLQKYFYAEYRYVVVQW